MDPAVTKFRQMQTKLLIAVTMLSFGGAMAAGFDCSKAYTPVEKLVCDNETLSRLDTDLGYAYNVAVNHAVPSEKRGLVAGQRDWVSNVRDRCADKDCLANAYSARIHALVSITTNKSIAEYVFDRREFETKASEFQRDLNAFGIAGKLSDCKIMLHLVVDQATAGRDMSYGAICSLNARDVMICDDTMVGKFTMKLYGYAESGGELADFTSANCPPGG